MTTLDNLSVVDGEIWILESYRNGMVRRVERIGSGILYKPAMFLVGLAGLEAERVGERTSS